MGSSIVSSIVNALIRNKWGSLVLGSIFVIIAIAFLVIFGGSVTFVSGGMVWVSVIFFILGGILIASGIYRIVKR